MVETQQDPFDAQWLATAAAEVDSKALEAGEPLAFAVTFLGGPRKESASTWRVEDSSVTAHPGVDEDVVVTFSTAWDDGIAILSGELEASVAYMQGRLKVAGDMSVALQLLEWSATAAFDGWRQRVTALS